jgi:hypothetical protein
MAATVLMLYVKLGNLIRSETVNILNIGFVVDILLQCHIPFFAKIALRNQDGNLKTRRIYM